MCVFDNKNIDKTKHIWRYYLLKSIEDTSRKLTVVNRRDSSKTKKLARIVKGIYLKSLKKNIQRRKYDKEHNC